MGEERLWSVAEISDYFDVTPNAVQKWIRAGHFPGAYKKGPGKTSPYAVPESAVFAFEHQLKHSVECSA